MIRNFLERILETAERHPHRVAVESQRPASLDAYDYAALVQLADRYASWLIGRGVQAGDRCALLAGNDVHWCGAYLGILGVGGIAVPLDTAYSTGQIRTLVLDCQPAVLLADADRLAAARGAVAGALTAPVVADLHETGRTGASGGGERRDPGAGALWARAAAWSRDAAAVILYTSGTTSDPKGVVLTHANLIAEAEAVFRAVDVTERDAVLGVLPLFHALAQMANLLLPFWVGARVVFLEQLTPPELLRALAERDCSAFCCVPQFYYLVHQRIFDRVRAAGSMTRLAFGVLVRLNSGLRRIGINGGRVFFGRAHRTLGRRMRLLVTGGSRFDPAIAGDFHRLGFDILQAYGLTECSGAATVVRPGTFVAGSVGTPLPGVEVRLAPVDGAGTEPGVGEVAIRGPIVMRGYYNRPDSNTATLRDGWLHTGDLGRLDAAGHLHITGRIKEVIILSSGKNIYPEEIEAHYTRSPVVRELCVIGASRPGEPSAERLHAIVVPDEDVLRARKIVNVRELVRFELETLSVALPHHKRVLGFDLSFDPLPRTTTRKLKRFEIEKAWAEGQRKDAIRQTEAATLSFPPDDDLAARVVAVVRRRVTGTPIGPASSIELDLGLDSMERVELLTDVEASVGRSVPPETASGIMTVGDLVGALRQAASSGTERPATADPESDAWQRVLDAPAPDDPAIADLRRSRPVTGVVYFVLLKVLWVIGRVLIGLRTSGTHHLPAAGPCLVCPNHQSFLDGFLVSTALPFRTMRQVFLVGAPEYFTGRVTAWLARSVNLIPVDPDANLVRALQVGAAGLRMGKILVLFPEGERSIDGELKTFRKGGPVLASRLDVPIVPVALDGSFALWPRGAGINWSLVRPFGRHRTHLRFGPPIHPGRDGVPRDEAALADHLQAAVAALLAESRRRA
jgi:long-chain acyl-CoA synthetase